MNVGNTFSSSNRESSLDDYRDIGGSESLEHILEQRPRECRDEYMDIFGRKCLEQIIQHVVETQVFIKLLPQSAVMCF